jgi:hypothetical protein
VKMSIRCQIGSVTGPNWKISGGFAAPAMG